MKQLSLICVLLICAAVYSEDIDPRIKPGALFTIEYEDMGKSLAYDTPRMVVHIPTNYSPDRLHPLFLWYNGGDGKPGVGFPMNLTNNKDFVCVSMSLFKPKPPTPEQRAVDQWAGLYLHSTDGPYNWERHSRMLEELYNLVPNLHPEIRIAGGFSNGAHLTAYLIDTTKGEFQKHFNALIMIEGGYQVNKLKAFKGSPIMFGWGETSQISGKLRAMPTKAKASGLIVTQFEMAGTGHDMPKEFWPEFAKWIPESVIPVLMEGQLKRIELLIRSRKHAMAIKLLSALESEDAPSLQDKIKLCRDALEKRATSAFERIKKMKVSNGSTRRNKIRRLEKFLKEWAGTAHEVDAQAILEELQAAD